MAVILYEHNKETYQNILEMFKTKKRVGVVQPTGTGKSFLILKWLEDNIGQSIIVLSPSMEIFNQLKRYASEMNAIIGLSVLCITYEKLNFMSEEDILSLKADKIILDEFHRAGAEQWGKAIEMLLDNNVNAQILGLTATPVRYLDDARNMADELFNGCLAREMTLGEAVALGILPVPQYVPVWYDYDERIAEYQEDIAAIEDDKKRKELENTLNSLKKQLENAYGAKDIFKANMPTNHGKWIVFCKDVSQIDEIITVMKDWLSEVNTNIHSYISVARRNDKDKQLQLFINDNDSTAIKILYTVDRFNEGIHIDNVDGIIMLRPTKSPIIYLQQMGRALSSKGTKRPIIFDMVNNYQNVMIDYGNGSENIFEKELYDIARDKGTLDKEERIFKIFELQMEFKQLIKNIDILFIYDAEEFFNKNLMLLRNFMNEYKREPYRNEVYKNLKIGSWCVRQREKFNNGRLSEIQILKLQKIGFSFDGMHDIQFKNNLFILKDFIQLYDRMPSTNEWHQNTNISDWYRSQVYQYHKGTLLEDREKALREIGVTFIKLNDIKFYEKALILKDFIKKYNRQPYSDERYENFHIGSWCATQRRCFINGKLSREREAILKEIGFEFTKISDSKFYTNLIILEDFIKCFGRAPYSAEFYKNVGIGRWCEKKRDEYSNGTLSKEQEKALREIGFEFLNAYEQKFYKNLSYFTEFMKLYGREPRNKEVYKNVKLGSWWNKIRYYYNKGTLPEYQKNELLKNGFLLKK